MNEMITYSQRLDITKYTRQGKDYIGNITTVMLLKEALDSLSIDLRDQFCFINELINDRQHILVLTATDKELVDEVIFQFEKKVNTYNLALVAKHYDIDTYSLLA
ncbi:MAG: hypothetical protein RR959_06090 [Erysipelotrichaceae bacterium]